MNGGHERNEKCEGRRGKQQAENCLATYENCTNIKQDS